MTVLPEDLIFLAGTEALGLRGRSLGWSRGKFPLAFVDACGRWIRALDGWLGRAVHEGSCPFLELDKVFLVETEDAF